MGTAAGLPTHVGPDAGLSLRDNPSVGSSRAPLIARTSNGATMNRSMRAFSTLVAVMATAVVCAPVAGADPSGYDLTDYGYKGDRDANAYAMQLHGVKLGGTTQEAANLAATMCSKFDQGASGTDLITAAQLLNGLSGVQAATAVWDAAWHFCPSHYH